MSSISFSLKNKDKKNSSSSSRNNGRSNGKRYKFEYGKRDEKRRETEYERIKRKKRKDSTLARIVRGEVTEEDDDYYNTSVYKEEEEEEEEADSVMEDIIKNLKEEKENAKANLPLLLRNQLPELIAMNDEDEKFKYDLEHRPDEVDFEDYEEDSIDGFGLKHLKKFGYKKGDGIGLNKKEVKPILFVPRHHRLGLGATPSALMKHNKNKNKNNKDGNNDKKNKAELEVEPMMVVPLDKDGNRRHYRTLDEELVPLEYDHIIKKDTIVMIIKGRHKDLEAKVLEEVPITVESVKIRLPNEQTININPSYIISIEEYRKSKQKRNENKRNSDSIESSNRKETNKKTRKNDYDYDDDDKDNDRYNSSKKLTGKKRKYKNDNDNDNDYYYKDDQNKKKQKTSSSSKKQKKNPIWVTPNICVRIISKKFNNGKYYCKKVKILDVISIDHISVILLDDSHKLLDVSQNMLETALPKVGGNVKILQGKHKNLTGILLKRNSKSDEATVQLYDDSSTKIFSFDQLAALL